MAGGGGAGGRPPRPLPPPGGVRHGPRPRPHLRRGLLLRRLRPLAAPVPAPPRLAGPGARAAPGPRAPAPGVRAGPAAGLPRGDGRGPRRLPAGEPPRPGQLPQAAGLAAPVPPRPPRGGPGPAGARGAGGRRASSAWRPRCGAAGGQSGRPTLKSPRPTPRRWRAPALPSAAHGALPVPALRLRLRAHLLLAPAGRRLRGAPEARPPPREPARAAPVARALPPQRLRGAPLPPDGGQPHLPAGSLGRRRRGRQAPGCLGGRRHGLPLDRRLHEPAPGGGLAPPPRAPCRRLLPHARRLVGLVGAGARRLRPPPRGLRPRPELGQLDVALLLLLLLSVLPLLLPRGLPEEVRQAGSLRPPMGACSQGDARRLHLRTVEGAQGGAGAGRVRGGAGLPEAYRGPPRSLAGEHGAHEGRLRRAQGGGPAGGAGGQTRQGLTGEEGTGRNSPPPRLSHFNGLGVNRALQFYYHLFYQK